MLEIIKKYIANFISDEFHRYKSWDHCFKAFSVDKPTETHALELAFYLASWGMYRGSSGLLQKNHLLHKGSILLTKAKTKKELNLLKISLKRKLIAITQ